jgi:hypothetical protein
LIDQWLSPGRFEKLIHALQTGRILPSVPVPRDRGRTVRSRWQEPEVGRFFEVTDQETRRQQSAGFWTAAGFQTGAGQTGRVSQGSSGAARAWCLSGKDKTAGREQPSGRRAALPILPTPCFSPGKSGAPAVPFVSNGVLIAKTPEGDLAAGFVLVISVYHCCPGLRAGIDRLRFGPGSGPAQQNYSNLQTVSLRERE